MTPTVAVVGASLAGLSAARALRAQSYDGRVVVVGDERHTPYDRPPLSKALLAGTASADDLALGVPDDAALELDWRLGTAAVALDPATRTVRLADGGEVRADGVVLATGARARRLPGSLPGVVAVGDCAAPWSAAHGRPVRTEHWTHAPEQPATAVATLLGSDVPVPPPVPYSWSDQYGARIQFAGCRREGDDVRVVEGSCADRSSLAVYERDGRPVAVLGVGQPRLFTRWRRQLRTAVPAGA